MIDLSLIAKSLRAEGVRFSLVGGYAVALHGAVRGTVDVDIVIEHTRGQFEACERALRSAGLVPRLPVTASEIFEFRAEYIARRNLVAWSFFNSENPLDVVDVIITHDLRSMRSTLRRWGTSRLPVIEITDLITMKRASGRPQDQEDVRMLEEIRIGGEFKKKK